MDFKSICVATVAVVAIFSTAFGHDAGEETRQFDDKWGTAIKEEFDGMPLPETSELPTATQVTPAIVKIGNRYGVPHPQHLGKKKHGYGNKDDYMDHMLGASLMSGGALISLGALALVVMASKALLFAFGAIALTGLSAGWMGGHGPAKGGGGGAVYEVVAKPQVTHGHSYSSEVHHEPYTPQLYPNDYSGYGYGGGGAAGYGGTYAYP
ncbi:uncharacterized protein LOC112688436 isoform X2 [Sipha flava]|uniref:Uncharacterized protein LOC112688436 isoform X2 n=1 Tax=Sipha flava TaxID=143950 RepID=A0A8B8G3L1_9HEMI|nr:uncharacterized protein LOC112688436 isoform X2 [Sipha flava]